MDLLGVGVLLGVAVAFIFGAVRSWRARRLWVKLLAGIPTTLLAVVFVAALGLVIHGYSIVNRTYANPAADVKLAATPAQLEQGKKIARVCSGCHSSTGNFPLVGQNFAADGPPLGTLWAANLTPAHLGSWTDGEIIRAIREGVGKDGRSLIIMPSHLFHSMSDDDVQSLVAYLRSQPAAGPDTPAKQISILGALMTSAVLPDSLFSHQQPVSGPVSAPPAGPTAEYGRYLATTGGCIECHGAQFQGGTNPPGTSPNGPSLVAFAKKYSEIEFIRVIRTGKDPDGRALSEDMPWKDYELYSDDDLRAIYAFATILGK